MIPDRLQYFLEHFWIDQKCDQIWTLGPRIYYQNTSNNTRNYGNILDTTSFVNLGIKHFIFKIVESPVYHVFVFAFCFCLFEMLSTSFLSQFVKVRIG